ncbi:LysR family transcriptional regulator [Duganella radicis]|uniref:LysR family transcriptional regulator n=1 Tax=Duganella radicis TaxID=551988 RepID=A0A6L6PBE9_9BURK|nr:LysR family transcriptional regulator [Duganella radicis]MTV35999.1 LysR family transcriptional regulator [Duganella radicis]
MPLPRYTLRQLEAFSTVAETLTFTEAGNRLGLTPSAVSQLVAELEGAVGFRLFDRSTRKVALTSAGKEFLQAAELVLRHLRLAEAAAVDLRKGSTGLVRIAAPMVIAGAILPRIIKSHAEAFPDVTVRIRDASVESMTEMVSTGEVDLAMGPDRNSGAAATHVNLFESPWVLWCAPTHALAGKTLLRWQDLRGEALVAAGRDHERATMQARGNAPDGEGITPADIVDNISTALGIAASGLAATLSPAYVSLWAERFGLIMRHIEEPRVTRQVCLYLPTHRTISAAARGFASYIAQQYGVGEALAHYGS